MAFINISPLSNQPSNPCNKSLNVKNTPYLLLSPQNSSPNFQSTNFFLLKSREKPHLAGGAKRFCGGGSAARLAGVKESSQEEVSRRSAAEGCGAVKKSLKRFAEQEGYDEKESEKYFLFNKAKKEEEMIQRQNSLPTFTDPIVNCLCPSTQHYKVWDCQQIHKSTC